MGYRFFLLLFVCQFSFGSCKVFNSDNTVATEKKDALFELLKSSNKCPESVQAFVANLEKHPNIKRSTAMVANEGFHNPSNGSFSLFEQVTGKYDSGTEILAGQFFFGHFTFARNRNIHLLQFPSANSLMIELIVWDNESQLFNFYELRGTGVGGKWFYRGNSLDALADNRFLHRKVEFGKKFGTRMRCSACHTSGGPIMKEMAKPQNDWWQKNRPLKFAPNKLSKTVENWLIPIVSADVFSKNVRKGIDRLEDSPNYQKAKRSLSLEEQLRPLFCTVEINLESDPLPLDSQSDSVTIPSGFWLHPLLGEHTLKINKKHYLDLLAEFKLRFDNLQRRDGDHSWLTPVTAYADQIAVQSLIKDKLIDEEFVFDVLAVDFKTPLFSKNRCRLLKLLPDKITQDWIDDFKKSLDTSSLPSAKVLLENLDQKAFNKTFHQRRAKLYIDDLKEKLQTAQGRKAAFIKLLNVRTAIGQSEISQNPLGQILEPGFRVIFPSTRN